jgi:hypothetical protein
MFDGENNNWSQFADKIQIIYRHAARSHSEELSMQLSSRTSLANSENTPETKRAKVLQRFAEFDAAVTKIEAAFADDSFSTAFGAYREALNLSRGFPSLEERTVKLAVAQAAKRLPRDWRMAKSLLLEVGQVDPGGEIPLELWEQVQQCERKETIDRALSAADAAVSTGTTQLARLRLAGLAAQYPGDPRLGMRSNVTAAPSAKPLGHGPPAAGRQASGNKADRSVVQAIRARAREFEKSGLYDEAVDQFEELGRIDPSYPGLKEEIQRCRRLNEKEQVVVPSLALVPFDPAVAKPAPRLKSSAGWNRVAAVGFSAVMLSVTADLMWMQYARSPAKPKTLSTAALVVHPPLRPTATRQAAPPPQVQVITPVPVVEAIPSPQPKRNTGELSKDISGGTVREAPKRRSFDSSRLSTPLAKLLSSTSEAGEAPPVVELPTQDNLPAPQLPDLENNRKAEEDAWASVNQNDSHSVESYLSRFPGGANREIAEQVLTNLRRIKAEHTQSAEVLYVLRQYTAAWNARNLEGILSLESYLDRRTLKAQLSPLKSLVMNLSPLSEPQVEGEQARVLCRRRVSEVFADNVEKQSPEVTVTFLLAKRNGIWMIESVRQ